MPLVRRTIIAISILLAALFGISQFSVTALSLSRVNMQFSRTEVGVYWFNPPSVKVGWAIAWDTDRDYFKSPRILETIVPGRMEMDIPWWLIFAAWALVTTPVWLLWKRKRKAPPAAFPVG